jgi:[protein]-arginine 3-hydroxylase / protease
VRLYARSQTAKLYPDTGSTAQGRYSTRSQGNISAVDVEAPDLQRFPEFQDAAYVHTIMRPGDMLFIPARWWHFVKSLSTSTSVTFWF